MNPRTGTPVLLLAATINGQSGWVAELDIRQDITYARSDRAVKPDPTWEFTDRAGHYHAWSTGGALPTLRAVAADMPCDGSCGHANPAQCEGYPVTLYECRVCDVAVDPQYVPDIEARTTGTPIKGLRSWRVRATGGGALVSAALPLGGEVSVVLRGDTQRTFFGFAVLASFETTGDGLGRDRSTVELIGTSELGERMSM